MTVTFMQTADAFNYADMLAATSRTVRVYAADHGCAYEQYLGLKKGRHPWQSCFNRIFMLNEMLDRGVTGWVCHMDADAWIQDLSFDIHGYLADKSDKALIVVSAQASDEWWDINDGVFLINLDHPAARRLIAEWLEATLACWHVIADTPNFPVGGPDDQSLLHNILMEGDYRDVIHLEDANLINTPYASFIRQQFRSSSATFKLRLGHIKDAVGAVLRGHTEHADDDITRAWHIVDALYLALLGRHAENGRQNSYVDVILNSGTRDGVELIARYITDSQEFQNRVR